jgi:hypothetical protein
LYDGWLGQAVFVITSAGSLYRSGDEGQSWTQQTRVGPVKAMSRTNNTDMQWFYNPVTGRAWKTDNQGLTYTAVAPDRQFVFLQAHPTLASTALAIISDSTAKNVRRCARSCACAVVCAVVRASHVYHSHLVAMR